MIYVYVMMVSQVINVSLLIALVKVQKFKENVDALKDLRVMIVRKRNAMVMENVKMENVSVILKYYKETIVMRKLVLETD